MAFFLIFVTFANGNAMVEDQEALGRWSAWMVALRSDPEDWPGTGGRLQAPTRGQLTVDLRG